MGGPADFVSTYRAHLPVAPVVVPVHAEASGYLAAMDTFKLGSAVIELGGGRKTLGEDLDLSVGLAEVAGIGEAVDGERPLAIIHAADEDSAERAAAIVRAACTVADKAPDSIAAIAETVLPD